MKPSTADTLAAAAGGLAYILAVAVIVGLVAWRWM